MCSVGLANPGEAFTVFYGERNPWCKYKTYFKRLPPSSQIASDFWKGDDVDYESSRKPSSFQGLQSTAQAVQVMALGLLRTPLLRSW